MIIVNSDSPSNFNHLLFNVNSKDPTNCNEFEIKINNVSFQTIKSIKDELPISCSDDQLLTTIQALQEFNIPLNDELEIRSALTDIVTLASCLSLYSDAREAFDEALEALTGKLDGSQTSDALTATHEIGKALHQLKILYDTVKASKKHPIVHEKMRELFQTEMLHLTWIIEDWSEDVVSYIKNEQKLLKNKKITSPQDAKTLGSALAQQLQHITEGVGPSLRRLRSVPNIAPLSNAVKKVTQLASDDPVQATVAYNSDEWQRIIDRRPIKSSWMCNKLQGLFRPSTWSESTKEVVKCIFVALQLSQRGIEIKNSLATAWKTDPTCCSDLTTDLALPSLHWSELEEQGLTTQKNLENGVNRAYELRHQILEIDPLAALQEEAALLHQELITSINQKPVARQSPRAFEAWLKTADKQCYAIANLEKRIQARMSAWTSTLPLKESESFGKKHANCARQAMLAEALHVPGLNVPISHGVSSDTIRTFLQKMAPEVFDHWTSLGSLFEKYEGERFLEEVAVTDHLESIHQSIQKAFSHFDAFENLSLSSDLVAWLEKVKGTENYLMVRSSGAEDTHESVNAGGNVSKAYVLPTKDAFSKAIGDVVCSYFGSASLQNRMNAQQNPFEQELKLGVASQELIGESVGGNNINQIPVSVVIFTNEPLYIGDEKFRVMRISASYGHGEGVVGNQGIATDTALLLISAAHPDQLYVLYDNQHKPTRLAPIETSEGIILKPTDNPTHLQNSAALNPELLARLYHWGIVTEAFFGEATDMEIVIKEGIIYPVQARPVKRLPLQATYLDRRKLNATLVSPIKESVRAETVVPGKASAFLLTIPEQILRRAKLQEAEIDYQKDLHQLVVVHQPEPANSHPVVNFSGMGIPCLNANAEKVEHLIQQINPETPVVICMQTGSIHLWDIKQGDVVDFISEGFAAHPAKIAISIPGTKLPSSYQQPHKAPQNLKNHLIALRDETEPTKALEYLNLIEHHPWIQNCRANIRLITDQASRKTLETFDKQLGQALTEIRQVLMKQQGSERLKSLFHIKVLESLLLGDIEQSGINQYALPDIWATLDALNQLTHYQKQLSHDSHVSDLLLFGNQGLTPEVRENWWNFLLFLESKIESKTISSEKIHQLRELVTILNQSETMSFWLSFFFKAPPPLNSAPSVLEKLTWALPKWLTPFVPESPTDNYLRKLLDGFGAEDKTFINRQLDFRKRNENFLNHIDLFFEKETYDLAWDQLQSMSADLMRSFADLATVTSPIGKAIAYSNIEDFVDVFDRCVKTMKSNPNVEYDEKVLRFKQMLHPYFQLLKGTVEILINPTKIPVHKNWPITKYLSTLEDILLKIPEVKVTHLKPSKNFSVSAAILGASTALSRHYPVTLEDFFTLVHQNHLYCVAHLNQELISHDHIQQSNLPLFFKLALSELDEKYPMRSGFSVTSKDMSATYNIPLRNHSAKVRISQDVEKDHLVLKAQLLGLANIRWGCIASAANLLNQIGAIKTLEPVYQTDQELTFHWKIQNNNDLKNAINTFENMIKGTLLSPHGHAIPVTSFYSSLFQSLEDEFARKACTIMLANPMHSKKITDPNDPLYNYDYNLFVNIPATHHMVVKFVTDEIQKSKSLPRKDIEDFFTSLSTQHFQLVMDAVEKNIETKSNEWNLIALQSFAMHKGDGKYQSLCHKIINNELEHGDSLHREDALRLKKDIYVCQYVAKEIPCEAGDDDDDRCSSGPTKTIYVCE